MIIFGFHIAAYIALLVFSVCASIVYFIPKWAYEGAVKDVDQEGYYKAYCDQLFYGLSLAPSRAMVGVYLVFLIMSLPLVALIIDEEFDDFHPLFLICPISWIVGIVTLRSHFYDSSLLREKDEVVVGNHFVQRLKDFMLISWVTWVGLLCAWLVPIVQEWYKLL